MSCTAATSPPSGTYAAKRRGREGEDAVAAWWQARGWRVLARNYCGRGFEIDLIVSKARTLSFVEVKARQCDLLHTLDEFITPRKRKALQRGAQHFIAKQQPEAEHYRFDLCLYNAQGKVTVLPDVLAE